VNLLSERGSLHLKTSVATPICSWKACVTLQPKRGTQAAMTRGFQTRQAKEMLGRLPGDLAID